MGACFTSTASAIFAAAVFGVSACGGPSGSAEKKPSGEQAREEARGDRSPSDRPSGTSTRRPRNAVPGKSKGHDSGGRSSAGEQRSSPALDASEDRREVQRRRRASKQDSEQLTPYEKGELSKREAPEGSREAPDPADEASRDEARDR